MTTIREKLNGREISQFLGIDWNSEGKGVIKSKFDGNLIYHAEYMWDHLEHYIIEFNEDKTEKTRWNVRDLSWFDWK